MTTIGPPEAKSRATYREVLVDPETFARIRLGEPLYFAGILPGLPALVREVHGPANAPTGRWSWHRVRIPPAGNRVLPEIVHPAAARNDSPNESAARAR